MLRKFHRKGVLGIVYRKKESNIEYLLLHRIKDWKGWEPVKGGRERRLEKDALEDELFEETRLKSQNVRRVPYRVIYRFPGSSKVKGDRCIGQNLQVFAVEVNPEDTVMVDFREHDDYYWTNYSNAKEMLKHDQVKTALEIVHKRLIGSSSKKQIS